MIHLHAKFRTIPSMQFLRMLGTPNHTMFCGHHWAKIGPILTKIKISFLEMIGLYEHATFRALPFILLRMLGNPNFTQFFGH